MGCAGGTAHGRAQLALSAPTFSVSDLVLPFKDFSSGLAELLKEFGQEFLDVEIVTRSL